MNNPMSQFARMVLPLGAVLLAGGCGGFVVLPDVPDECFQEDVVGEECYTEITTVEVCDEICDFFGCYDDCYLEDVVDVYCEDVIIDSYIICEEGAACAISRGLVAQAEQLWCGSETL